MIKDFIKLTDILNKKFTEAVEKLESVSVDTEEYTVLLGNIGATLNLTTNINRTLIEVAATKEESKDESNN